MKKTLLSAAAVVALSALPAAAATQTGNLNVTTTIQVSCQAPSPSGTLRLPFDSDLALNAQSPATGVTVTVTCYGNPTVNHVTFDNGDYRDATNVTEEDGVRYMLRSGSGADSEDDYLGYKIYASEDTNEAGADLAISSREIGTTATSDANRLTFTGAYTGAFNVTGRVFESSSRAGAFGDPTNADSGGAVPGGTYNDLVVMTVDYN